jgi:uncharacterized protein YndB with AHSA1/START domain
MYGQLERQDDHWRLTFVRTLDHPPERVWRGLTEPEHLAAWFPTRVEGEWAIGAALRFVFPDADGPALTGEVLVYEPHSRLSYRWGEQVLDFRLRPDPAGCVLTFVLSFDTLGTAAPDAAGWHVCLDRLGYDLDAARPPWRPDERWAQVHAGYLERLGPEAATIGPPGRQP